VASSPVDTGDLPGDIGDELQSLALELYDAAKVKNSPEKIILSIFVKAILITLISLAKNFQKN